jgi:predicted TIM-barrel fold metal-dependent hydrolase
MTVIDAQVELAAHTNPITGCVHLTAEQLAAHLDSPMRRGVAEEPIARALVSGNAAEMIYEHDVRKHHTHVVEAIDASEGRLIGAMTINPLLDLPETLDELRRLVTEEGFVAVRLDPSPHSYLPHRLGDRLGPIVEEAAKLNVPVIFQMGNPPFSNPVLVATLAENHPDTTLVLSNLGTGHLTYTEEATYVAMQNPNVFLNTAGASLPRLRYALSMLGSERILFGSGFPAHDAPSQLVLLDTLSDEPPIGIASSSSDIDAIKSENFLRLFPLSRP